MPSGPIAFFISSFWQISTIVDSEMSKSSIISTSAVHGKIVRHLEFINMEAKYLENNSACVVGSLAYSFFRCTELGIFDFFK